MKLLLLNCGAEWISVTEAWTGALIFAILAGEMIAQTTVDWWPDFYRLAQAWRIRPEGTGGLTSMAGFQFQLAAGLLTLLQREASGSSGRVLIEALSDTAVLGSSSVVVTQAKLSLRSGALSSALAELWKISSLAEQISPLLSSKIAYRVLTSRQLIADADGAIERWTPPNIENDDARLVTFKKRVSVHAESDPVLELARVLVNVYGFERPLQKINEWIGSLLAASSTAKLEAAADLIAIDVAAIAQAARDVRKEFYIWQARDQPPAAVLKANSDERPVLVGELPKIPDLSAGRFAPDASFPTFTLRWKNGWKESTVPTLRLFRHFGFLDVPVLAKVSHYCMLWLDSTRKTRTE